MKSILLKEYRSSLVVEEQTAKELNESEIRIKTAYAGLSFTDRIIQQGLYKYQRNYMPLPHTPGFEASGIVIEIGENVTEFVTGDNVVVLQRSGCLSSEIITKSENVIKIPEDTDLAWAASLPVNFFTASHALHNIVKIFPNSRLLITSAAGGVGGMLTQLASRDHRATALVGAQNKKEYALQLGADQVYTYKEFFASQRKSDAIFTAAGTNINQYIKTLNHNGKLIIYGFHSMVPKSFRYLVRALVTYFKLRGVKLFDLVYQNRTISGFNIIHLQPRGVEFSAIKKHFVDLIEAGNMPQAHKVHIYKLENVNKAMADLASGDVEGKIVIRF